MSAEAVAPSVSALRLSARRMVPRPELRGQALLERPCYNKGTAFTDGERTALGLHGLLPPQVETLDQQVVRAYEAYRRKNDDLERHIYLRALQDTNEVLFYRLLLEHMEEMTPIVYTPVVALGCQEFSHIYRRPRGLFVPYPLRDSIRDLLRHRPHPDVDVIVVTDGERILGIGDQGAGGLAIPIGKLSLYTLIGGIRPDRTLPVVLDVGTNNAERLRDPEYLGWRHERVTGDDYYDFVEQFVLAVRQELPGTLVQWEDFGASHARPILERYRDRLLTFNDDIQGTGAVAVAAVLSALGRTGGRLSDQRVAVLGAGSGGTGVADALRTAMVADGLDEESARRRFYLVNHGGLLTTRRADVRAGQSPYLQPWDDVGSWAKEHPDRVSLLEVVRNARPTVLVGLSTVTGAFDEPLVREMSEHVDRPIVFPLSNPTARSEATPEQLLRWTGGRALVATGSPFDPVELDGVRVPIAQCNNVYVFPAVGLGVVASRARRVTDGMFLAAARRLAELAPGGSGADRPLLPPVASLREVARELAVAVGLEAQRTGHAELVPTDELARRIAAAQWTPEYPVYSAL